MWARLTNFILPISIIAGRALSLAKSFISCNHREIVVVAGSTNCCRVAISAGTGTFEAFRNIQIKALKEESRIIYCNCLKVAASWLTSQCIII